jgi:hypothetical protein
MAAGRNARRSVDTKTVRNRRPGHCNPSDVRTPEPTTLNKTLFEQLQAKAQIQQAQAKFGIIPLSRKRAALQYSSGRYALTGGYGRSTDNRCSRGTNFCKSLHDFKAVFTGHECDLQLFDDVMTMLFEIHPRCGMEASDTLMKRLEFLNLLSQTERSRFSSQSEEQDYMNGEVVDGSTPFDTHVGAQSLFDLYQGVFDSSGSSPPRQEWCRRLLSRIFEMDTPSLPLDMKLSRNTFFKCCDVRFCKLKPHNVSQYLGILGHRGLRDQ